MKPGIGLVRRTGNLGVGEEPNAYRNGSLEVASVQQIMHCVLLKEDVLL